MPERCDPPLIRSIGSTGAVWCAVFAILAAVLLCASALAAEPPLPFAVAHEWHQSLDEGPGLVTYRFEGVTILISATDFGESGPRLQAIADNGATITIYGMDGSDRQYVLFKVLRLDPEHSTVDVLFANYTGGAHCCADIKVLSLIEGTWRVVEMEEWDGGPADLKDQPRDADGDGRLEFVHDEDRFLYIFCGYVDCETPLRFPRIENGQVIDISTQPSFRLLHLMDMLTHQQGCAEGGNGACAAFVASAARAGHFAMAWQFMLDHYDRNNKRGLDMGETERAAPIVFDDFPSALAWFLRDAGYLDAGN